VPTGAEGYARAVKHISLFEQALKIAAPARIEDLGYVSNISRRDCDKRVTFTFRAEAPVIEYLSLLIENKLLLRTSRGGRVYAGFEKLSRMEPVAERYLRIADLSERVYIFGEADWKPARHPNMKLIEVISTSPPALEWFVVADSSSFRVALVAVANERKSTILHEARQFRAFKSSDPGIVTQLAAFAEELIDTSLAA
jgi:diguanylate cyclase/two-component system sensory protein